jgi:hypothetical protein
MIIWRDHGRFPATSSELSMDIEPSDLIVGLLTAALGLIGLILAAGALDNEMFVFGFALFGFACVFVLGLVRRHFDRLEAARVASDRHV